MTVTSSRPAVVLGEETLLTLERLDQSYATSCAVRPIVRGTRSTLRPKLLHIVRTVCGLFEGDVSTLDDTPPQLKSETSAQRGRA